MLKNKDQGDRMEEVALDMLYQAGDCQDEAAAKLLHMGAEIILAIVKACRAIDDKSNTDKK